MSKNVLSKADLIQEVLERTEGLTKKAVSEVIAATLETITDSVAKGDEVNVIGFGKFSQSQRAARKGRNPSTGAEIDIPAATLPKFSAGKAFKDKVNA